MKFKTGSLVFVILSGFLLLISLLLIYILRCPLWAYGAVAALFVVISIMKLKKVRNFWISGACLILCFSLSLGLCVHTRQDKNVSFLASLVANFQEDFIRDKVSFEELALPNFARWAVPKGFENHSYKLTNASFEFLENQDSDHKKLIIQLHGGAYIDPLVNIYRDNAVNLSHIGGGVDVASVDYRTYPEVRHPAALKDVIEAYELLEDEYGAENIVIIGDSAGGGLALALTMYLRNNQMPIPAGLVVMSPWTDLPGEGDSYTFNLYNDPLFGASDPEHAEDAGVPTYYGEGSDLHEPYLSPAYGSFEGFPPLLIQVGSRELLYSDSETVYKKCLEAGVEVTFTPYEGMFHVFQLYLNQLTHEGVAAWTEVETFIHQQFGYDA